VNPIHPYRPRLITRRTKFAPAKPRFRRGSLRKEALPKCANKPRVKTKYQRNSAVAGQPSGRRVNRLPEWIDPKSYITKGGRHRLYGHDYLELQWAAYRRAGGLDDYSRTAKCECGCGRPAPFGIRALGLKAKGELAHNEHGPRKSDELHRVKWMRHECHMKSHNAGGKPCPKKETANVAA
jgi:hypothetical protein